MTALFLHGIAPGDTPAPAAAPQHLRIEVDDIALIATSAEGAALNDQKEPSVDTVLAHHRLLSAYALETDVLPVRFGTVFSSASGMLAGVATEAGLYRRRIARLRGHIEYALAVVRTDGADISSDHAARRADEDGRGFLARKRAARDGLRSLSTRRADFARAVPDGIAPVAADMRAVTTQRKDALASYAILVPREGLDAFLQVAEALAERAGTLGLGLSLRGPGPCYSFADPDDETSCPVRHHG